MRKRAHLFQVTRNSAPIEQHNVRNKVNSNIQYATKYREFAACIAAGLDIEKWLNFGYSNDLKADVIAFWELSGEIAVGQQDAKNRKEEAMHKRAAKKGRRR